MLLAVSGDVLDGLVLAGNRVDEIAGGEVEVRFYIHILGNGTILNRPADGYDTRRGRIGHNRAGFDIIEPVALLSGHCSDVVGVHMAGKDILHTGVGKFFAQPFIVIHQIHGKQVRLHAEVGDVSVVLNADDGIAALLGNRNLLQNPVFQICADCAAGFLPVGTGIGIIRAVPGAVDGDDGKAVFRSCHIG